MDALVDLTGEMVARNLRERFGGLEVIRSLDEEALMSVPGVGQSTARKIVAAFTLSRESSVYDLEIASKELAFQVFKKIFEKFDNPFQEQLVVLPLSIRNKPLRSGLKVYTGTVSSSQIRVAEVLRPALLLNAPALIMAHNHPSGDQSPSPEDLAVTKVISRAGLLLDIELIDHLILGLRGFCSIKAQHPHVFRS